jgi:hypothetical protein
VRAAVVEAKLGADDESLMLDGHEFVLGAPLPDTRARAIRATGFFEVGLAPVTT